MSDQEKNISQNKEEKKADSWWSLEEGFLEKKDRDLIERENNKGPEKEPNMDNTVDLIKEKIEKRAIVVDDEKSKDRDGELSLYAEDISKMTDVGSQIESLTKLATEKDPITAIKVAKHLDENYVLDKFHDKLMEEEIKKILIEKGLL